MMSVRINFEIGHEASIRSKRTPEGFTHDWEVFVRGCDSDASHYIDRVVFHLHETFQKPKRAIKEPPYSVKESGYAGFVIPIDIYLKNRDEPKKIHFNYDLSLQNDGPAIRKIQKEKYVFHNPSEEFKKKLLKGGGVLVNSNLEMEKVKDNDNKLQLTGKPKLGGDITKKHKPKDHRSDESKISNFAHLFGTPINTGSRASPEAKKTSPVPPKPASTTTMSSKKDDRMGKEKIEKSKSKLSPIKDKEKDNFKSKDSQDKVRDDKKKLHNKDRDRSKEKPNKASSPRPKSPKRSSPPLNSTSTSQAELDQQKVKTTDSNDAKKLSDSKDRKQKKEKKGHERDKKDHKRDKEREKDVVRDLKLDQKVLPKDKDLPPRELVTKDKIKDKDKSSSIKMSDTPKSETDIKVSDPKSQDKKDIDRRHKHKKKDKSRKDELKTDRDKDKKVKLDKVSFSKSSKEDNDTHVEDIVKIENVHEPPSSLENLSEQASSDTEDSVKSVDEPVKLKTDPIINSPCHDQPFNNVDKQKDKAVKKHKDKSKNSEKDEKRRKRKSKDEHTEKPPKVIQPPSKLLKVDEEPSSDMDVESLDPREGIEPAQPDNEPVSIDQMDSVDPVSSPQSEDKAFTPDYMSELKELQHKIMTLQDNTEIQDIVQMVAETGQFEITKKTFDFDLCTLDRSTVQRLQEFFASS